MGLQPEISVASVLPRDLENSRQGHWLLDGHHWKTDAPQSLCWPFCDNCCLQSGCFNAPMFVCAKVGIFRMLTLLCRDSTCWAPAFYAAMCLAWLAGSTAAGSSVPNAVGRQHVLILHHDSDQQVVAFQKRMERWSKRVHWGFPCKTCYVRHSSKAQHNNA